MFSFLSLHQHAHKRAAHASLMGQCEVPLLGDYEAARHLGEGVCQPHLAAQQSQAAFAE